MLIKRIELEGFGSFVQPFKFTFDTTGVVFIEGDNGAGKSTLIKEGLVWGLYGKTKKVNIVTWESKRTDNFKGCRVKIDFHKNYKNFTLCRHIGYLGETFGYKGGNSVLLFEWVNDMPYLLTEHLNKAELQQKINDIIGVDHKGFLNTVILAQNSIGLISASNVEKRKIFEEIFNAHFLNDGAKIVEGLLKENDTVSNEKQHLMDKLELEIKLVQEKKNANAQDIENFNNYVLKEVKELKQDVSDISIEIEHLKQQAEIAKEHLNKDILLLDDLKVAPINDTINRKLEIDQFLDSKREYVKALHYDYKQMTQNMLRMQSELDEGLQFVDNLTNTLLNIGSELEQLNEAQANPECYACGQIVTGNNVNIKNKRLNDKIKALQAEWEKTQDYEVDTRKKIGDLHRNIQSLTKSLEMTQKELQPYFNPEIYKEEKAEVIELEKLIKNHENAVNKYQNQHVKVMQSKLNYEKIITQQDVLKNEVKIKQSTIHTKENLAKPKDFQDFFQHEINTLQAQLNTQRKEQELLHERYLDLKFWKQGFSAKGIKGYIFDTMLQKLNSTLEIYAEALGIGVKFGVDKTKANRPFTTEVTLNGEVVPFEDLNGGHKQRINLILPFAISDLLINVLNINLFVLDEGFSGLDETGRNALVELIRLKANHQAIYLITHNKIIDTLYSKTIKLEVKDGTTIIAP